MRNVHGTLGAERRLQWLVDRLAEDDAVSLADAADALEVSEMTIRRDLVGLEERGAARHRIRYDTHDLTDLVTSGENVLGASVADGWWRGFLS